MNRNLHDCGIPECLEGCTLVLFDTSALFHEGLGGYEDKIYLGMFGHDHSSYLPYSEKTGYARYLTDLFRRDSRANITGHVMAELRNAVVAQSCKGDYIEPESWQEYMETLKKLCGTIIDEQKVVRLGEESKKAASRLEKAYADILHSPHLSETDRELVLCTVVLAGTSPGTVLFTDDRYMLDAGLHISAETGADTFFYTKRGGKYRWWNHGKNCSFCRTAPLATSLGERAMQFVK